MAERAIDREARLTRTAITLLKHNPSASTFIKRMKSEGFTSQEIIAVIDKLAEERGDG